jgi:hypothetical protein
MRVARMVLETFIDLVDQQYDNERMLVEAYQNGREQGFALFTTNFYVSFSECRNTDQIVVYKSKYAALKSITPEMYDNARYFSEGDYVGAAEYILEVYRQSLS